MRVTPLTVLLDDGKVLRPKLGGGDPTDAFRGRVGRSGPRDPQQHALAAAWPANWPATPSSSARSRPNRSAAAGR